MRISRTLAIGTLALAGSATLSHADVDAAVRSNVKLKGTIDPVGEIETLRIDASAGSVLTIVVAAKKKAPLDLTVAIFDPDGAPVSLDSAAKVIDKDKKVAIKKLPLARSGEYRVEISATGTGEYAAKLKSTPAKKITRTVSILAGTSATTAIAAPPGSKITIKASAPKGEASLPRIDAVGAIDASTLPGPQGNKHTVKITLGEDGGDVDVDLTNTAGAAGTIAVQATIKPPKLKVQKLDVRGVARGKPDGGETVVIRAVGAAGGVVEVAEGDSPIDGVSLVVPPGALLKDTSITVSTVFVSEIPQRDERQAAGEPVEFGPDGLQFESDATLVIPWDPSSLPVGADPLDLRVLRIRSDGSTEVLVPISVDVNAGTMTASVSGFSTFVPVVPRGTPNIEGSDYWFLGQEVGLEPDFQAGFDSRARLVDQTIGIASFGPRGQSGGFTLVAEFRDVTWTHDQDGRGSIPVMDSGADFESGSWDYAPDGQTVTIASGDDSDELALSEDGAFLLAGTSGIDSPGEVEFTLAVRKESNPTLARLAGTYHVAGSELAAPGPAGFGPLETSLSRFFGTLTVNADGTFSIRVNERFTEFRSSSNSFVSKTESFNVGGTARIGTSIDGIFEDALIFLADPERGGEPDENDEFVFLPGEGGRVMLGTDLFPLGDGQFFFVAVRQIADGSKSALDGEYLTVSVELDPTTYETSPPGGGRVTIGDFETCGFETFIDFDGNGRGTELFFAGACFGRDESQPDGIFQFEPSGSGDPEDALNVKVAANGKLTSPGEGTVGAIVSDGSFFLEWVDAKTGDRDVEYVLGIRLPPSAFDLLPLREE